jgi:hypothetical protein
MARSSLTARHQRPINDRQILDLKGPLDCFVSLHQPGIRHQILVGASSEEIDPIGSHPINACGYHQEQ